MRVRRDMRTKKQSIPQARETKRCHAKLPGGAVRVANTMAQQRLDAIVATSRECGRFDGLCAAPSAPAAPAARVGAEYWGGHRPRRSRGRAKRALACGIGGMLLGDARTRGRR